MSPRRNFPKGKRPNHAGEELRGSPSNQYFEDADDGYWVVRKLTGSSATKPYRCPGCDQMILLATPHIVAWLEGDEDGRRHWHNACWEKRGKRKPNTERTRNAPRY
jgi:hypothetical protein